jgi:predicted PurR-regulated permease PerM
MIESKLSLRLQLVVLVLIVGFVVWLLAPALTPFVIAATFAYLFNPLVGQLQRLKLSRALATAIVFLVLMLLLVLVLLEVVPYLQRQVTTLIRRLPDLFAWLQNDAVGWLNARFDLELEMPDTQQIVAIVQQHWREAGGAAAIVFAKVSSSGFAILGAIAHAIIVPIAFFYLLRDWPVMIAHVRELLPRSTEPTITRLARASDETLSGFMRGQLSVMLVLGIVYAVGLRLIGLEVGPLIGVIAGLISFVPYLGAILGVAAGVIAAVAQFHDWLHVILVLVVFQIGHVLEVYVLVPRFVGGKIGLHPLAVIFAVLAGGELFGFLGILLALPVASVVMVLLRYAYELYRDSALYRARHQEAAEVMAPPDLAVAVTSPPPAPAESA